MLFPEESFFTLWHIQPYSGFPQVLCCSPSFPFPFSISPFLHRDVPGIRDPRACTPEKLWFSLSCRTLAPLIAGELWSCLGRADKDISIAWRAGITEKHIFGASEVTLTLCHTSVSLQVSHSLDPQGSTWAGATVAALLLLLNSPGFQLPVHILHALFIDTSQRKLGFRFQSCF